MKKLIVIGIVMVMVMSASAAMAVTIDNDWLVYVKASTDAAAKVGAGNATFGLKTAAGDSFANYTTAANVGGTPEINYKDATHPYTTNYGAIPGRTYVAKFGGAPLGVEVGKKGVIDWAFKIAGAANATVYLTSWNTAGTTTAINALTDQVIKLYLGDADGNKVGDAIWEYKAGTNGATWTGAGGIVGTANSTSAANAYFQQSFTLGAADNAGAAYKYFVLEATVPEPGSMVALFSGLIGLVGFGIRRRK